MLVEVVGFGLNVYLFIVLLFLIFIMGGDDEVIMVFLKIFINFIKFVYCDVLFFFRGFEFVFVGCLCYVCSLFYFW